tara:strand:- start:2094 stop:3119 length:1026 start_codon:yes stop_codon:yes gene_type:complete
MNKINSLFRYISTKKTSIYIKVLSKIDNFGFSKTKKIEAKDKKIIYYSVCLWGKEYIEIFNDVLIPSLLQKDNIPKLKKFGCVQKIFIFTKDNEYPLAKKNELILKKYLSIEIVSNQENIINDKYYLKNCLTTFIKKSLKNNAYSMVLTPDHVYGNSSIYNLFISSYCKDTAVACVGARINWKIPHKKLSKLLKEKKTLQNSFLVSFTFKNLHPSMRQSINIKSSHMGLKIYPLDKNNFLVCASRVNVCIVKFRESDLRFFRSIVDYNNIDYYWPRLLIKEARYKFIGDSDFIFYSELTKENLKFQKTVDEKHIDHFYGKNKRLVNHIVNESYFSLWKSKI